VKSQDIKALIKETRKEMKAKGIKRTSCFNGGLSTEVYSLNARMFQLETQLAADVFKANRMRKGDKRCSGLVWHEPKVCVRGYWRQCGNDATHKVGSRHFCESCRPVLYSESHSGYGAEISSETQDESRE